MKELFKEIMAAYDAKRAEWIAEKGNDEGFNDWFTAQIIGRV